MHQLDGEPLDEFVVRLRIAAKMCEFTDEDNKIRRQIINGCSSTKLRQHILETTSITLKQITNKAGSRGGRHSSLIDRAYRRQGKRFNLE